MKPPLDVVLLLSRNELPRARIGAPSLALIAPGIPISEQEAADQAGCPAHNLNRYLEAGSTAPQSRRVARLLKSFLADLGPLSDWELASQNDTYQYHLRHQNLILASLEAALEKLGPVRLRILTQPYEVYWSPMRPALAKLHDETRTHALLVCRLADHLGVEVVVERRPVLGVLEVMVRAFLRKALFEGFRWLQLVRKTAAARRDTDARAALARPMGKGPIGVIVRTDSEVISARFVCDSLTQAGVPYVLLHDEMLSSQTTLQRIRQLGLPYVSIGTLVGWPALFRSLAGLFKRGPVGRPAADLVETAADAVLVGSDDLWRELSRRLRDFAPDQKSFAIELDEAISRFDLSALVTFAFVDQWRTVIRETGARRGLATIAVQNAAQDPEEYPRLVWADHYCVESTWLKARLVDMGYPSEGLTATGLAHFASNGPEHLPTAEERLANRQILILTQPIYDRYFQAMILALAHVAAAAGFSLAVKYHPRQSATDYAEAIAVARKTVKVVCYQQEPLDDILLGATLSVSVVSSALIRALYLATPVFSLLPIEERHLDLPYVTAPTMERVDTVDELADRVAAFAADFSARFEAFMRRRDGYLEEHASFEPGPDAQANVLGVIQALRKQRLD